MMLQPTQNLGAATPIADGASAPLPRRVSHCGTPIRGSPQLPRSSPSKGAVGQTPQQHSNRKASFAPFEEPGSAQRGQHANTKARSSMDGASPAADAQTPHGSNRKAAVAATPQELHAQATVDQL